MEGEIGNTTPLPYWQSNVPPSQRTPACPPFLLALSPKDISILSTPDSLYHTLSWPSACSLIARNRIDLFRRLPSSLRAYLSYIHDIKSSHGSVMNFMLQERLHWSLPIVASGMPFENEGDLKVLRNDWPYGIDGRIVHLVVWTKFVLEADEVTDDLTDEARAMVGRFVDERFVRRLGEENVIWFKNWGSLKSIRAVEHFHVMLFDPDPAFVEEVTGGDVAVRK